MHQTTTAKRIEARQEPFNRTPVMYQTWINLLFLHWEVDPVRIQASLPKGLSPDLFNGKCYAGATPFSIKNIHIPYLPSFPLISSFHETNVRTYVLNEDGVPGIWFYSLYANNRLAVEGARRIPLPYSFAEIDIETADNAVHYKLAKLRSDNISYQYLYKSSGELFYADSESLEFFLVERYYLFYINRNNGLKKIRVSHSPYPLQKVDVTKSSPGLLAINFIEPISVEPVHRIFSPGPGEVKIYLPEDA